MNEELKITLWEESLGKQSRSAVLNGKFTMSSLHQEGLHSGQDFLGCGRRLLTAFQGSTGDRGWREKGMTTPLGKTKGERKGMSPKWWKHGLL